MAQGMRGPLQRMAQNPSMSIICFSDEGVGYELNEFLVLQKLESHPGSKFPQSELRD